jgi:hypothetical protein
LHRTAPGSRRSRACRERHRRVADRRHAAEPTIADAARRDAAAKRLRGDGERDDGEPALFSFLFPLSSFLAAVFLLSAPAVQDRVHDSVTLSTPWNSTSGAFVQGVSVGPIPTIRAFPESGLPTRYSAQPPKRDGVAGSAMRSVVDAVGEGC